MAHFDENITLQIDIFYIESVSLGKLTHCLVGHDGDGPGEGWFLVKVMVYVKTSNPHEDNKKQANKSKGKKDANKQEEEFFFPCNK